MGGNAEVQDSFVCFYRLPACGRFTSRATCRTKQEGREEVEEDSLHAASLEVAAQDCSGFGEEEIKCGGWIVVSLVQGVACISFAETHLDNLFHLVVNSYNLSHT